ncbi:MAG: Cdc6/Cdc18 family protein [Candidatus Hodarchaeales archaeon]
MNEFNLDLKKLFKKKSIIIKDESVFEPTYIPECIVHRENELRLLANHFKTIIFKNTAQSGKQVIIQGSVGSGKTVVAKQFGVTIEEYCNTSSEAEITKISFFHMNCRRQRSWYLILTSILQQLVPAFPIRGFSTAELLAYLLKILDERREGLLLCLDEIDYLLSGSKEQDILYSLIRYHEGVTHDNQFQISLMLVTRNAHFQTLLDPALISSLSQQIILFKPYTAVQLFDILALRAQKGLYDSTFSDDILKTIVSLAYKGSDARYAIELLWRSAKVAEHEETHQISVEHVRKAQVSVYPFKRSLITDLSPQLKIILQALASLLSNMKERALVTTMELRAKYHDLCQISHLEPRKNTQFWIYLQELVKYGIIELHVENRHFNGKSAGRTSLIGIHDFPVDELLFLLESNQ